MHLGHSVTRSLGSFLLISGVAVVAAPSTRAQSASLRWAGHIADTFVHETATGGVEAWTVEDGGRIRHRTPTTGTAGTWTFQTVPDEVQDTLHRVFFLDEGPGAGVVGWAVGAGGWVLHTTNGGVTWSVQTRIATPVAPPVVDPWEELYDIHFLDAQEGWMIGVHSIWHTDDGGANWTNLGQFVPGGSPMTSGQTYDLHLPFFELYGLDVVERADGSRLGLIVGQPGIVLKSESSPTNPDLTSWVAVWDVGMLCPTSADCGDAAGVLEGCACAQLCNTQGPVSIALSHDGPWMEIWDVEIGEHPTEPLALLVGGVGFQCGMIFSSTDDGDTWGKDWHECTCPTGPPCVACNGNPLYNPDPQDPSYLYRLQYLRMQYGVHLFSDNSAVSVGYNGQHTLRDPVTGLWQDRSEFAAGLPTVAGSITFPLSGAGGVELASGAKVSIIGGMGGQLRESFDGGNTWATIGENAPHRITDVCFLDDLNGWHVGQFYRISRTVNQAESWDEQDPPTVGGYSDFLAIACETSSDQRAVAVGNPFSVPPSTDTLPKIRYTNLQSQPVWFENQDVTILGQSTYQTFLNGKALYDATWTGSEFWAVGQGGLAMKSADGGATWRLVLPAPETQTSIADFQMEGVAFRDTTTGLIVGRRLVNSVLQGVVYQYSTAGGSPTWTALTLPSGVQISGLWDVAIGGDTAWVVGEKLVAGETEGIVLTANFASGFGALTEEVGPGGSFPRCTTGESPEGIPVLNAVAVAPVTGEVWAGGGCGRLWMRATSGAWTQVKSQTDAHVLGMCFVNTAGAESGYLGCFRSGPTQQSIIRVQ